MDDAAEPSMADLATQLQGPPASATGPPSPWRGSTGGRDAGLGIVATTIVASIGWGLLLVLWGPVALPPQLSRLFVAFLSFVPLAVALVVLAVGFVSSRRGVAPKWIRRWAVVAVAALAVGYTAVLTNMPMKIGFALSLRNAADPPAKLDRPATQEAKPSDCGRRGSKEGRVYSLPVDLTLASPTHYAGVPVIYYCPQGIDVDSLMTNHSDFEPLGGPWWIDWQSD